ncbi:Uncharacterized protein Mb2031c [Chlamydiales bacterium SCGC AG-110-P3]|nr:Uncharacterized protein Mb2031c [Chlamydiales bacterium SCGC AG-110-P3]
MYKRHCENELRDLAAQYPVVTVTGPRQSGKTTLVRYVFSSKPYVNLENPDSRELADSDPRRFLSQYPEGAVLDEIQRCPVLLSYIQVIVDESGQKGMYILTGSLQLELHEAVTQSLAGRTALLSLWPMSLAELSSAAIELSLDEYLLLGGFPRVHQDQLNPTKAYRNYFQTYVERDLRTLINVKDLSQFQRFVRLCAGRIGHLVNFEGLSSEVGVSSHTIKNWISILETSFVTFRLAPYFENLGKRLVKSPKLYFCDVGFACYLLGIETLEQLARDPLRGQLVENLVVLELTKLRQAQGLDPNLYFFRDAHGHEVDVIFKSANQLIPIEVKSAKTFNKRFLQQLNYFRSLVGERCPAAYLVYDGDLEQIVGGIELLNFRKVGQALLR